MTHQEIFKTAPKEIEEALVAIGLSKNDGISYIRKRFNRPKLNGYKKIIHAWMINELVGYPTFMIPKDTSATACKHCGGSGAEVIYRYESVLGTCPTCKGAGVIRERMCRFCDGTGEKNGKTCPNCGGEGLFPTPCKCQIKDKSGRILSQGFIELKIIKEITEVRTCQACHGYGGKTPRSVVETNKRGFNDLLKIIK